MTSPSPSPVIRTSKTYVIISAPNPTAPRQLHLAAWDLAMLSTRSIHKGLLFANPPNIPMEQIIEQLKGSLEETLFHFYALSGRMRLVTCEDGGVTCHIEVGIGGAQLVHAKAEGITIADVADTDGRDLPDFLKGFFPLDLAVNFDACTNPLLAVQVTELDDGFFIGCAFNHALADGTSFWNFFNAWAEICRARAERKESVLSKPPVHDRFFLLEGCGEPPIKLPFSSPDEFIVRYTPPPLRERMFHFSSESLAKLKAKANEECREGTISTFQALSALMWRCITRARGLPSNQETRCRIAIQNRSRLQPPLSPNYFGNSINIIPTQNTTAGELLSQNLGWAAWLINQAIANHTDSTIREFLHAYRAKPVVFDLNMFDIYSIMISSSPRFDMYTCDFGWGKPLAVRSGSANKLDGKIAAYPGWEGSGSIDLEVCLLPQYMSALEKDEEFMAVVSPPVKLEVLVGTCSKNLC